MIHLVDTNYSIANPRSRHPLQVSRDQTTPSVVRFGRPLSSHVLFLLRRGIFCSTCSNFSRISSYYRHAPFEAGPLSCWIQWHTVAIRLMILGSRNGAANVKFRPKKAFFFFRWGSYSVCKHSASLWFLSSADAGFDFFAQDSSIFIIGQ